MARCLCRSRIDRAWRGLRQPLAAALLLCAATLPAMSQVDSKDGAPPPAPRAAVALEEAFRYVTKRPPGGALALAAQGTPDGQWRFVSRSGEMFTVGTAAEMRRVASVLYPDAQPGTGLALYITEDTLLGRGVRFRALPAGAERHVVVGDGSYRLLPRDGEPLYAEVRPGVGVAVRDNPLLQDGLQRLGRPLAEAGVRLLVLEPDGPGALAPAPPADAGHGPPGERIDPARLAAALAGLAGQTLVVCARGEGDLVRAPSGDGPEHSVAVAELMAAARDADVALVVLQFAAPPQPATAGACPGGAPAAQRTLADILEAAVAVSRQAPVAVALAGRLEVLDAVVVGDLASGAAPVRLGDARQRRLGRDLIAAIVAYDGLAPPLPAIYAALVLLGWLGTPVARKAWGAVWRVGDRSEYPPGGIGYAAARVVDLLVFALVFQPLTSVLTAPLALVPQIWRAMMGPMRVLRRLARLGAGGGKVKSRPAGRQAA